jgi:hypothetical protein
MNLSANLLANGPVLNSGDTIGVDANVQGRITLNADPDEYRLAVSE